MTPKPVAFTPERMERFKGIVAKYERPASALMPSLYLAEEQFGFLAPEVLEYVAGLLDVPPAQAFEVAHFYSMYKKKDMGRHCLQVCNNITCTMLGSEELIKIIHEDLGIKAHEVSADKVFSYVPVQCLGSCDTAPVVQINDEYHENMTPEGFRELLKKLRAQATREVPGGDKNSKQAKGEVTTP